MLDFNLESSKEEKIDKIYRYLKRIACRFVRNKDDGDDLIQDAMVKCITNLDKFKDGTNIEAWGYCVMRNVFIDQKRRDNKTKMIYENSDVPLMDFVNYINGDNNIYKLLHYKEVMKYIQSQQQTEQIGLFKLYAMGMPVIEISKFTGKDINSVKGKIYEFRRKLINYFKSR